MEARTKRRLRIVSGGQTGVDRAALDVAVSLGLPCGGWCPAGRRAVDGPIDRRYPLQETPSSDYPQRTEWNVLDSDATLILAPRPLGGGTALTAAVARRHDRPLLIADPAEAGAIEPTRLWIVERSIRTLNGAGPRERDRRTRPVHTAAEAWLRTLLLPFV